MSEYNKKRLYWIKLSETFMTSDTVDFLMEQKNGANYVVLYQMLCLKTVNNNGELTRKLGEVIIPYNVEKIQRDTKWFSIDTVRVALELYKKLGLIYENQNGNLAITDFSRLIGSTTISAEKKQLQLANRQGGKKVEKIPPYIDIDKDIDKDIDISKEKQEKEKKTVSESKHRYGEYKNVLLTDKELQKLKDEYPSGMYPSWEDLIKYLDEYIAMKGYKAKSHYLAIKKWVIDAIQEDMQRKNNIQKQPSSYLDTLKQAMEEFSNERNC